MAGIIIFLVVAFAFFIAGMINIALSPVLWETLVRCDPSNSTLVGGQCAQLINSAAMQEAGFTDQSENLFLVWKYSPLIFFFCGAIFAFQGIRRRGQQY